MLENTTFQELDLFPSSGEGRETTALLDPWKDVTSIMGCPVSKVSFS
jgi:hypothetical protein